MIENRIAERSRCKLRAEVKFDGETIRCIVADMSVRGVRLSLPCAKELPGKISVSFPWRDQTFVKKRWQSGFDVGVEFEVASTINASRFVKLVDELAETKRTVERLARQLTRAEQIAYND